MSKLFDSNDSWFSSSMAPISRTDLTCVLSQLKKLHSDMISANNQGKSRVLDAHLFRLELEIESLERITKSL